MTKCIILNPNETSRDRERLYCFKLGKLVEQGMQFRHCMVYKFNSNPFPLICGGKVDAINEVGITLRKEVEDILTVEIVDSQKLSLR